MCNFHYRPFTLFVYKPVVVKVACDFNHFSFDYDYLHWYTLICLFSSNCSVGQFSLNGQWHQWPGRWRVSKGAFTPTRSGSARGCPSFFCVGRVFTLVQVCARFQFAVAPSRGTVLLTYKYLQSALLIPAGPTEESLHERSLCCFRAEAQQACCWYE